MKKWGDFKFMAVFALVFYTLAIVLWQVTGQIFYLLNFFIIGTALALGTGLWPVLPREKKHYARKLSQVLVGGYLFFGLGMGLIYLAFGIITPENMQIEGFWLWLLSGTFAASVIHYFIAKILGPLIFNRGWCGWACWTAAVLDLLPWQKSPGRARKEWGYLRYVHFALSLGIMLVLFYGFNYTLMDSVGMVDMGGGKGRSVRLYASLWKIPELWWFLIGNMIYYALGITLAAIFKDNRAFCKYICPITVFLKLGSRASLLKIKAQAEKCTYCKLCEKNCPMDIKLTDYIQQNQRVMSSECILCLTCTNACPHEVLSASIGLDIGLSDDYQKNLRLRS